MASKKTAGSEAQRPIKKGKKEPESTGIKAKTSHWHFKTTVLFCLFVFQKPENKTVSFAENWMELEITMLKEIR